MSNFVDIEQLSKRWGRSISSIRRDWYSGAIPQPIRLGRRAIRWPLSAIVAWEDAQQGYTPEPKPEESYP